MQVFFKHRLKQVTPFQLSVVLPFGFLFPVVSRSMSQMQENRVQKKEA